MKRKHFKILAAVFVIVAVFTGFLASISEDSTTYFYTVSEVIDRQEEFENKKIRIMGFVKENSVLEVQGENGIKFLVTEDFQRDIQVNFNGIRPDLFREGQGVVAEGYFDESGKFVSDLLLVKHTEDYKTPHDDYPIEEIKKSLSDETKTI